MVGRGLLVAAIAVAACACASTEQPPSQSGIYVVGDHASLISASSGSGAAPESEFSVIKRVYWFFAGR
jgi:hypothetical protein